MASRAVGCLEVFNPDKDDCQVWFEVFENYCMANDIKKDEIQKATCLTLIGTELYGQVKANIFLKKMSDIDLAEIKKQIESLVCPKPSLLTRRTLFRARIQKENESITQFVLELKKLADKCEFRNSLEVNMKEQTAHGLRDLALKKKILDEEEPNWDRVAKIIKCWVATRNSLSIESKIEGAAILQLKNQHRPVYNNMNKKLCKVCGYSNHDATVCRFRTFTCRVCHTRGHLAAVCHLNKDKNGNRTSFNKKKKSNGNYNSQRQNNVKQDAKNVRSNDGKCGQANSSKVNQIVQPIFFLR